MVIDALRCLVIQFFFCMRTSNFLAQAERPYYFGGDFSLRTFLRGDYS